MRNDKVAEGRCEQGSAHWYLFRAGDFVKTQAVAIQRADAINRERLRLAFPQMVAAFEASDWDKPPPCFIAEYNAPGPEAGMETHPSAVMRNLRRILKQGGHVGCDFCFAAFRAITDCHAHERQAERDQEESHEAPQS